MCRHDSPPTFIVTQNGGRTRMLQPAPAGEPRPQKTTYLIAKICGRLEISAAEYPSIECDNKNNKEPVNMIVFVSRYEGMFAMVQEKHLRYGLVMKLADKVELALGIIILIVFIGSVAGLPDRIISSITEWGFSIIVGIMLGTLSGFSVELFTGDWLKRILFVVSIGKIKFSISLFTMTTFLVQKLLFG